MIGRSEEDDDLFSWGIRSWLVRLLEREMTKDQGVPLHLMEFYSPLRVVFTLWVPVSLLIWMWLYVLRETCTLGVFEDSLMYGFVGSALIAPGLSVLKARENFRKLQRGVRSWLR